MPKLETVFRGPRLPVFSSPDLHSSRLPGSGEWAAGYPGLRKVGQGHPQGLVRALLSPEILAATSWLVYSLYAVIFIRRLTACQSVLKFPVYPMN